MRTRSTAVSRLLVAVVVLGSVPGLADEPATVSDEDEWSFVVEGSTQFPLFAGGGIRVESPWDLDFRFDAGFLPEGYGRTVNDIAQDLGGYDDATAFHAMAPRCGLICC